ncbi:uncharacterized protein RCC_01558 [Ramularia collo-cygni]|uniref:BTB domain-containing protein n=1 Tax=Ramularia collo-cygni TaxID=112498 RepID=A0A2D3UZT9_9PEZI|nr:uncharacterized protein RCC_01558 [Ramularia collo-cygni]CZT15724.1 uncharacterized protein RCC_01558 [Ramularia collo-cygni]
MDSSSPQLSEYQAGARRLYASGVLTDFTIICGDKRYEVHRAILICHSAYFKACFLSGLREAEQRVIDLKDDPPQAVELMIQYFYDQEYDVGVDEESKKAAPYTHSTVYAVADKYLVPALKALARVKFGLALKQGVLPPGATQHIYESTPETDHGLRDLIFLVYATHIQREKENNLAGLSGNVPRLIGMYKHNYNESPELAAEIATFASFSQAGVLRSRGVVGAEVGSQALINDVFAYLGMREDKTRETKLRALTDLIGITS